MRSADHRYARGARIGSAAALALAITGCATQPTAGPGAPASPASLYLVGAGELELPDACEPRPGTVYRVSFVVQGDGRVARVEPGSDAGCVEESLAAWVHTFEYRAPGTPVPTVLDWMGVTAARLR